MNGMSKINDDFGINLLKNLPIIDDVQELTDSQINELMNIWKALSNHYVPKSGIASTLIGEIIRAMNNIYYYAVNDNDMIGNLQNIHHVEAAMSFICKSLQDNINFEAVKRLAIFEGSFQDYSVDIQKAKKSSNPKEIFYKHKKVTEQWYIQNLQYIMIELMNIFKEESFLFQIPNNEDYKNTSINIFLQVIEEQYGVTKEDLSNIYNEYVEFISLINKE